MPLEKNSNSNQPKKAESGPMFCAVSSNRSNMLNQTLKDDSAVNLLRQHWIYDLDWTCVTNEAERCSGYQVFFIQRLLSSLCQCRLGRCVFTSMLEIKMNNGSL